MLSISVVYRRCAIPVACCLVGAHEEGSWKPLWIALFDALGEHVLSDWIVIVMADRGSMLE